MLMGIVTKNAIMQVEFAVESIRDERRLWPEPIDGIASQDVRGRAGRSSGPRRAVFRSECAGGRLRRHWQHLSEPAIL